MRNSEPEIWLDLSDLTGDPTPVSLEAFLADNQEVPPGEDEVEGLVSLRVGQITYLGIGGGAVRVRRVEP